MIVQACISFGSSSSFFLLYYPIKMYVFVPFALCGLFLLNKAGWCWGRGLWTPEFHLQVCLSYSCVSLDKSLTFLSFHLLRVWVPVSQVSTWQKAENHTLRWFSPDISEPYHLRIDHLANWWDILRDHQNSCSGLISHENRAAAQASGNTHHLSVGSQGGPEKLLSCHDSSVVSPPEPWG